ncbi:hypothetical protein BKA70DRAFT_754707 [Coprinopsis sp. MPI-PUGE-AT-0042]|nr:hypothetical protein BKA70DRAFT_754707 [Coprinopsis sp. MPI-PUGE-AT-0042]
MESLSNNMLNNEHSPPFAALPVETLSPILLLVTESDEFPNEILKKSIALLKLGFVCRRWYHLILSEPHFWTSCSASLGSPEGLGDTNKAPDASKAEKTLVNSLEVFYSRSGSSLPLSITLNFQSPPTDPAIAGRLATLVVCRANRWASVSLKSRELVLDRRESWIYTLIDLASRETERMGSSPFKNVESLSLKLSRSVGLRSGLEQDVTGFLSIDVPSLTLSSLFPNISSLSLQLFGTCPALDSLYDNVSFKRLATLNIDIAPGYCQSFIVIILDDLLARLPALRHLDASGLMADDVFSEAMVSKITHPTLETLKTDDPRFYAYCGSLCFPGLQTLAVGGTYVCYIDCDPKLWNLRAMLSTTQLRRLILENTPIEEVGLRNILRCVNGTLESLVLFAPLGRGRRWEDAIGQSAFTRSEETNSASVLLPQLSEILVHADELPETQENGCKAYDGFCAFRDAFIKFVDDPRRWAPSPEPQIDNTNIDVLDHTMGREGNHLEVAHFGYKGGVVYHRGREVGIPSTYFTHED